MSDISALALLAGTPPPPPPPPPPPSAAAAAASGQPEGGGKPQGAPGRRALGHRALDGDVLEPDLLTATAHEIETLDAERAHALVAELGAASDYNAFKLGGVLARIHGERWYDGRADFKSYVQEVHGFGVSKAFYLVNIYNAVVGLGLSWKDLKPVGWSKLKELAPILTKDNAAEWLARAADPAMTVLKLHALVKAARGLVSQLQDPYSELFSPRQLTQFNTTTAGRYGGLGLQIEEQPSKGVVVSKVFPHTPAEAAGAREGDMIVAIDTVRAEDGKVHIDVKGRWLAAQCKKTR